MKEYKIFIDDVIKELLPEVVKKYIPNIRYTSDRRKMISMLEPYLYEIMFEYRFNKFQYIIDRIYQLSGVDKNEIINDYNEIKNDISLFKNKLKNEIIIYLKNIY